MVVTACHRYVGSGICRKLGLRLVGVERTKVSLSSL